MRKIICFLVFILCTAAQSQSLTVFDIDTTAFPTIKAKFYAFDADGKQIINLSPYDFELTENGEKRTVTNVSCPSPHPPEMLSGVLVFDISGSMSQGTPRIESAKNAARAWIDGLPSNNSECALVSFSDYGYVLQDFTTNKQKIKNKIDKLNPTDGTDYNQALLDVPCGGLQVAAAGKYKRVVIFLTDGLPDFEPKTAEIINFALQNNIVIFAVTLDMSAPQCIKDITEQTGGIYFENIMTKEEVEECYLRLLMIVQGIAPCSIEWETSKTVCKLNNYNVNIKYIPLNSTTKTKYYIPEGSITKLEFNPSTVSFLYPEIGVRVEETVKVTAHNADFNVTNITSTNPSFYITPTSFILGNGQTKELIISYIPADSGYNYCKFNFENNLCSTYYNLSGGWRGIKPKIRTLKLLHPNGGEFFVAGIDTVITWEGVAFDERVYIEYSTNNGTKWKMIADSAFGLSYKWHIPKTPSNQCLARITASAEKIFYCDNSDVPISNKLWMGCNLDVMTYRNGDTIPQVTDSTEWAKLTTGAWCYYNNDFLTFAIYGKLYNWYAVNDPRGLAPAGWHIATDEEWKELEMYLGMSRSDADNTGSRGTDQGGKLKEVGTRHWKAPNKGATDEIGFSALPGGWRNNNGKFCYLKEDGAWWTSSENNADYVWGRYLYKDDARVIRYYYNKNNGFSVRCVKD